MALFACGSPEVIVAKPPAVKPPPPPKVALVLGGGGARGFAHVGVLEILEAANIPVDLIVGTSVGSLIGAMYAHKPKAAELQLLANELDADDLFDYSLLNITRGPVKGEAVRQFVRRQLNDARIEDLAIPFVAMAADLNTGQPVEFTQGSVADAVRASVSIPGLFAPARVGDRNLIDGGVVANLAVDVAHRHGADVVIAVDITEPVEDHDVDDVLSIAMQAVNIMMADMARRQQQLADVIIAPDLVGVGMLDFGQRDRCMAAGRAAAEEALDSVQVALSSARRTIPPVPYPNDLAVRLRDMETPP